MDMQFKNYVGDIPIGYSKLNAVQVRFFTGYPIDTYHRTCIIPKELNDKPKEIPKYLKERYDIDLYTYCGFQTFTDEIFKTPDGDIMQGSDSNFSKEYIFYKGYVITKEMLFKLKKKQKKNESSPKKNLLERIRSCFN